MNAHALVSPLPRSLAVAAAGRLRRIADKPVRPRCTTSGRGLTAARRRPRSAPRAPLVLADIEAAGALDGSAVLYRLGLRRRAPAAPLCAGALERAAAAAGAPAPARAARARAAGAGPGRRRGAGARAAARCRACCASSWRSSRTCSKRRTQSCGLLRLRATLMENTPAGEKLLAQRSFVGAAAGADAPTRRAACARWPRPPMPPPAEIGAVAAAAACA